MRLWDTATGTARFMLSEGEKKIARAFFSPDGKHILTTSEAAGGTLRLWSIAARNEQSVVMRDFAELRENSREHPLMAEIEELFRTPSPSQ